MSAPRSTLRTALITGAGSGIGAASARLFHSRGWFVGLFDLNADSVAALAAELGERHCSGFMDVTDSKSVVAERIAQAVREAATTRGMYWIMPKADRLLYTALRKMPLRWTSRFANWIQGNREMSR